MASAGLSLRRLAPVFNDALAITLIQAVNFLVPLAALPFLTRGLGVVQFGLYAAILNYSAYVVLLADYSFNMNGPLRVRSAQAGRSVLNLLLDSTLLKLALLVPGLAAFLLAAILVAGMPVDEALMAAALPAVTTLTPRWAVYGLGHLYRFFGLSLLVRLTWLGLVVWLVRSPADLLMLLGLSIVAQAVVGLCCFRLLWPEGEEAWQVDWRRPLRMFREDAALFGSTSAATAAKELNVLLLSAAQGVAVVSLYAVADRMRLALLGLSAPLTQALFLFVVRSKQMGSELDSVRTLAGGIVVLLVAAGCLAVFALAEPIVLVLAGPEFREAAGVLRLLCLVPPVATLNALIGLNTLVAEGYQADYARGQLWVALLSAPLALLLVFGLGLPGAALSALGMELLTTGFCLSAILRRGLLRKLIPQ